MPEHNRRLLPWVAYPAVMVTAFVLHAVVLRAGLPIGVSSYTAVVFGAVAVTLLEFAIPYDRSWQPNKARCKERPLVHGPRPNRVTTPDDSLLWYHPDPLSADARRPHGRVVASGSAGDHPSGADAAGCGVLPLLASRRRPQHETLAAARCAPLAQEALLAQRGPVSSGGKGAAISPGRLAVHPDRRGGTGLRRVLDLLRR